MKTRALIEPASLDNASAAGRFPQGFVAELTAPKRDSNDVNASSESEASPPTSHGVAVFRFTVTGASTVKLVAEFTGWDKRPLDLTPGEDGVWQLTVALAPGRYAYRFLVDGEWCDDPQCSQCEANPYGSFNAVVDVV